MKNYSFNNDQLVLSISNIVRNGMLKKKSSLKVLGYEDKVMEKFGWAIRFTDSDLELISEILNSICINNISRVSGDKNYITISPDEVIIRLFYDCYDLFLGARVVLEKYINKEVRKLYKKNPDVFKVYFEKENKSNKVK